MSTLIRFTQEGIPQFVSSGQFRMDNKQISFPAEFTPAMLEPYGLWLYLPTVPPTYNYGTHKLLSGVPELVDGVYRQTWEVVELSEEEITERFLQQRYQDKINPESIRAVLDSLGRILTKDVILAESLTADELASISSIYPDITPASAGMNVKVDEVYNYQNVLYKVLQAHTVQANWMPPEAPALFGVVPAAGVIPAWVMPGTQGVAADAYGIGFQVTHDNPNDGGAIWIYKSTLAANTTEPGRDSTLDRWWTPISVA